MALVVLLQQLRQELLQNVSMFFNSFLILVVFLTSFIIVLRKFPTKTSKLNLPPSPPKLPIIGNLHQLAGTLAHRSLLALSKKYGPIMFIHLGCYTPAIVITSAEIAKEMTKKHDIAFSNRSKTTVTEMLLYGDDAIIFGHYNELWRQARKVCALQLLSLQRVQSFQFVRDEEIALVAERIRCSCHDNHNVDDDANYVVNLTETLMAVSGNIMSRCVLGKMPDKEKDGGGKKNNRRLGSEVPRMVGLLVGSVCFGDLFPCLGFIDVLTGLIPRMKRTFKELDSYFDQVIEQHRLLKSKSDQDFVDFLLQAQTDGLLDFALTQNRLKSVLLDLFVAGTETTSTTMEWIMAELIKNPHILNKTQEEVRRVVGGKSKIDESDIKEMGYLKCVIKEGLRLHSPVPLMVPRETSVSVKLGGYDIPPKTKVFVNTWAIQRDSQLWGDRAEEFIPERFVNNPIDFIGQDFEFLPFGVGRRGCPGILFGVTSIQYVIANLLYWFDWELPNGMNPENMDMSEVYGGITCFKKVPLHLVPTLYSPP